MGRLRTRWWGPALSPPAGVAPLDPKRRPVRARGRRRGCWETEERILSQAAAQGTQARTACLGCVRTRVVPPSGSEREGGCNSSYPPSAQTPGRGAKAGGGLGNRSAKCGQAWCQVCRLNSFSKSLCFPKTAVQLIQEPCRPLSASSRAWPADTFPHGPGAMRLGMAAKDFL